MCVRTGIPPPASSPGWAFPTRCCLDEDGALARQYGVTGLPTTYFIDRSGRLHTRILGESAPQLLEKLVREML